MRVIWRKFWKVAIILHINDREKKEPLAVRVLRDYNAERRMTDFANHSSFCFGVLGRCDLCHLKPFERCIEFITKHRQVVVEFLACDFGVNLGGYNVRVSQYPAHALDGHSL